MAALPGEEGIVDDLSHHGGLLAPGPGRAATVMPPCALIDRPLCRRSLGIALVVGSALLAVNQGDVLLAGCWSPTLAWKIPLTYLVPFVVATWGALLNSRVR